MSDQSNWSDHDHRVRPVTREEIAQERLDGLGRSAEGLTYAEAVSQSSIQLDVLDDLGQMVRSADDALDKLGALRLAEIQILSVRRALVIEARTTGFSWVIIGDTLAITAEEAVRRYGRR